MGTKEVRNLIGFFKTLVGTQVWCIQYCYLTSMEPTKPYHILIVKELYEYSTSILAEITSILEERIILRNIRTYRTVWHQELGYTVKERVLLLALVSKAQCNYWSTVHIPVSYEYTVIINHISRASKTSTNRMLSILNRSLKLCFRT